MYFIAYKIRFAISSAKIPQGTHLIIGLGNPGKMYENTRHNIGAQFVKFLAKEFNIKMSECSYGLIGSYKDIILFNPMSFMNLSGNPIKKVAQKAGIPTASIIVVHDDLSSIPGKCKIKQGGSAEGHNGLKSIIQTMDDQFLRLKIGIGRPISKEPEIVSEYVLGKIDYQPTQNAFQQGMILIRQLLKF